MKLGVSLPLTDIGGDPGVIKGFAQSAEGLGYEYLAAADHVLGVNEESRPNWGNRNTSDDCFHDPFVLFGFLSACTERIGFSTQVLILPQRQAALVAKQAACLDVLSGGRFRFGIGIGWNEAEYISLNENFKNRGRRSVEQIEVMKALWSNQHATFDGKWHHLDDLGINPLPLSRSIPLWFGGHQDATLRRIAKYGDGWIMIAWSPGDEALLHFETLRNYVHKEGRNAEDVGIEVWVSASGTPDDWREEIDFWKKAGVSHVCLNNTFSRYQHTRIQGNTLEAHMEAMKLYRDSVSDLVK